MLIVGNLIAQGFSKLPPLSLPEERSVVAVDRQPVRNTWTGATVKVFAGPKGPLLPTLEVVFSSGLSRASYYSSQGDRAVDVTRRWFTITCGRTGVLHQQTGNKYRSTW